MAGNLFPLTGLYCPVIDARRSQVYTALFCCENERLVRLSEDALLPIDTLLIMLEERGQPVLLTGDAAQAVKRRASEIAPLLSFPTLPPDLLLPSGTAVARCALREAKAGRSVREEELAPVYLRPTQAERERAEREELKKKEQENKKENTSC
jgi:tRNA threonylcarbamoyladenosine biosynthesis protein TsaB